MKLLLTSAGLVNDSIVDSLRYLNGKDFEQSKLVFIPTAANLEQGDKAWLINDLVNCKNLNFAEVDIVDISALKLEHLKPRLENADIIVTGGGLAWYLMEWVRKSGLQEILPTLLESKVYVGISAGSMITGRSLYSKQMQIIYEDEDTPPSGDEDALGLVDFIVLPHLNSKFFPNVTKENAEKIAPDINQKLYLLDDDSAIQVDQDKVTVVSEGTWESV